MYFLFIDLETTGLNPDSDGIIEIGAVCRVYDKIEKKWNTIDTFQSLINPQTEVAIQVLELTNISQNQLDLAPKLYKVMGNWSDWVISLMEKNKIEEFIYCGHSFEDFDIKFLKKNNWNLPGSGKIVDTYKLGKIIFPYFKALNLEFLAQHLDLKSRFDKSLNISAHRALYDSFISAFLLEKELQVLDNLNLEIGLYNLLVEKIFSGYDPIPQKQFQNSGVEIKPKIFDKKQANIDNYKFLNGLNLIEDILKLCYLNGVEKKLVKILQGQLAGEVIFDPEINLILLQIIFFIHGGNPPGEQFKFQHINKFYLKSVILILKAAILPIEITKEIVKTRKLVKIEKLTVFYTEMAASNVKLYDLINYIDFLNKYCNQPILTEKREKILRNYKVLITKFSAVSTFGVFKPIATSSGQLIGDRRDFMDYFTQFRKLLVEYWLELEIQMGKGFFQDLDFISTYLYLEIKEFFIQNFSFLTNTNVDPIFQSIGIPENLGLIFSKNNFKLENSFVGKFENLQTFLTREEIFLYLNSLNLPNVSGVLEGKITFSGDENIEKLKFITDSVDLLANYITEQKKKLGLGGFQETIQFIICGNNQGSRRLEQYVDSFTNSTLAFNSNLFISGKNGSVTKMLGKISMGQRGLFAVKYKDLGKIISLLQEDLFKKSSFVLFGLPPIIMSPLFPPVQNINQIRELNVVANWRLIIQNRK